MTVDLQAALATLFYMLAYAAPLWLTLVHVRERAEGSLGPNLYAGLVATLAVIAMNARIGAFLDAHVTDAGSMQAGTLVALFTAAAASFGVAVFAWILPVISARSGHLIATLTLPSSVAPLPRTSEAFSLDVENRTVISRATGFSATVIGDLGAIFLGLVAISGYLLWPALLLVTDGQRRIAENATARQQESAASAYQSALHSYSIAAGARANELVQALTERYDRCNTDSCRTATKRPWDEALAAFTGWHIRPGNDGVFAVDTFTAQLKDRETALAVHARIDELAKRHRVRLLTGATIPKEQLFDPVEAERRERQLVDKNLVETGRELTATIGDPRRAMSLIAADTNMTLAIFLEITAIALSLAAIF